LFGTNGISPNPQEKRMSSNSDSLHGKAAAAHSSPSSRKNSYSRRRWSAFDAWQEHVRKSAAPVGVAFSEPHDRDLRRATIAG
jgi:hypothetical protein